MHHHFASDEEIFFSVYEQLETEVIARTAKPRARTDDPIGELTDGIDCYLDAELEPDVQRITLIDGPAVLGPEPMGRFAVGRADLRVEALVHSA